ncbi:MAG TPA: TrmB family transcriptional regulator [Firmicutes bacterium]|jgi:HTH-type transcriptional regulator, sugar sensing transcriptional regulator|nr:TrmB family transcriptional regulator [Bacillota bacterium]
MELIEALIKVGLTRHESLLYLTLCKEGAITGYEAAKLTGISRSNVYLALAGLTEKGGAYRIDAATIKYMAVPVAELVQNIRRQMEDTLALIAENVPLKDEPTEPYITISGSAQILSKMKNMIANATERIYLSCSQAELTLVEDEIIKVINKGLKAVLITSPSYQLSGAIIYYHEKTPGEIRLIADSSYVLTGELSLHKDTTCLYSRNQNLVRLIKDSLTNEIQLISLSSRNGEEGTIHE